MCLIEIKLHGMVLIPACGSQRKKLGNHTLRKLNMEVFHSPWNYNWNEYKLNDRKKMAMCTAKQ